MRLLAIAVIAALTTPALALTDVLSDAELINRAGAVRSAQEPPADRIIGVHRGARVIVDVRCGDVCPAYTVRIIRYDAEPGAVCTKLGGDIASILVPMAIGVRQQSFCIPHALYQRKLYVDHPYQK
jgi:hypothetical protein